MGTIVKIIFIQIFRKVFECKKIFTLIKQTTIFAIFKSRKSFYPLVQFDCEASLTKEELTEQNDCCSKVKTAQFWNIKEPHITLWWPGVRSVTCVGAWSALQHVARLGDHSEAQLTGLPVRLTWGQSRDKTRAHGKYKSDNWPILALHLTTTTPETAWLSRTRRVIRLQVIKLNSQTS